MRSPATLQHQRRYGSPDQRLVHERELRVVRELLRGRARPRQVLDSPCGYGRLAPLIAELEPEQVLFLDRNPARLEALAGSPLAQGRARLRGDLLAGLPLREGAVELSFCFRFLQHLRCAQQRRTALTELRRVTRGALIASYYRAGGLHQLSQQVGFQLGLRRSQPLSFLAPAQLAEETLSAGWRLVADRAALPGLHAQRVILLEAAARRV